MSTVKTHCPLNRPNLPRPVSILWSWLHSVSPERTQSGAVWHPLETLLHYLYLREDPSRRLSPEENGRVVLSLDRGLADSE